jgi:protein gp37
MGKNSAIEWTDHTFNPWIGCTKVSPACVNCYAERADHVYHWTKKGWGIGKPRYLTSEAYWKQPLRWNEEAKKSSVRIRVFCGSLCDVFDREVDWMWHNSLIRLIDMTDNL